MKRWALGGMRLRVGSRRVHFLLLQVDWRPRCPPTAQLGQGLCPHPKKGQRLSQPWGAEPSANITPLQSSSFPVPGRPSFSEASGEVRGVEGI